MDEKENEVMSSLKDKEKMDEELKILAEGIGNKMAGFKMTKSFVNAWYNIRQNVKYCSSPIDEIELEAICKRICEYDLKICKPTRQTDWENVFRDVIFCVKKGIE